MEYKKLDSSIHFRLDRDEEIISSIIKICQQEHITAGSIQGLGATKEVTLRYMNQEEKSFAERAFTEGMEITSFLGNISRHEGEPYLHCHITLARHDFTTVAGHCHEAVVGPTFEGIIRFDKLTLNRKFNPEIGLNLMVFAN